MENFEYSKALDAIEKFFWSDFCDNYLELAKVRSYGLEAQIYQNTDLTHDEKAKILQNQSDAASTMYFAICNLLLLFSPFIPNVTEEIYQDSIIKEKLKLHWIDERGSFAKFDQNYIQNIAHPQTWQDVILILNTIRKAKSENSVSLKTALSELLLPHKFAYMMENFDGLDDILHAGIIPSKGCIKIQGEQVLASLAHTN